MIAAALLSLLLVLGHAQASEKKRLWGKPPYASAYDGLLPVGMTPSPATDFHPSQLHGARVALVPSANFNEWARVWERWHDENGEKFDMKSRGKLEGPRNNSNPRNFSEHVVQVLQPYVGELFIANDLPQARDAGADYYLIVDGWLGAPPPLRNDLLGYLSPRHRQCPPAGQRAAPDVHCGRKREGDQELGILRTKNERGRGNHHGTRH